VIDLTRKQLSAIELLKEPYMYYFLHGGKRSGKTVLVMRYIILRCWMFPKTRHLAGRYRFKHAKSAIWQQTLFNPKFPLLKSSCPDGSYEINRSDHIIKFFNGSEIWLAGFDDPERAEKIFGEEYATIFINEGVQITYDTFQTLKSCLQYRDIPLKFILDANPRSPSHWMHKIFFGGRDPISGDELLKKELYAQMLFLPEDNKENLSPDYITNNLDTLTGVKKARLRHGIWCESAEGGVYRFRREDNHSDRPLGYIDGIRTACGWDFGISADVFMVWLQVLTVPVTEKNKKGLVIQIIDEFVNREQGYQYYKDVANSKEYNNVEHIGDPAGKARDAKLESWTLLLRQPPDGIPIQHPPDMTVADMVEHANEYMPYVKINEIQCSRMVEMFENWTYKKDKDGKTVEGSLPEHNEYSHPGTAFYYALAKLFPPKLKSSGVIL
jgi:phage terminase large subunit